MEKIRLRAAGQMDAEELFEWRNEEETRKNSFSSEPVQWENHLKWLEKKLSDKNCYFYILTDGSKDMGTIRLDVEPQTRQAAVSYNIKSSCRGKGLGGKILSLAEQKLKEQEGEIPKRIEFLSESVKPENKASAKCFLKNGYMVVKQDMTEIVYRKKL